MRKCHDMPYYSLSRYLWPERVFPYITIMCRESINIALPFTHSSKIVVPRTGRIYRIYATSIYVNRDNAQASINSIINTARAWNHSEGRRDLTLTILCAILPPLNFFDLLIHYRQVVFIMCLCLEYFNYRSARFLRISPPFDIRSGQWSHLWNALRNTLLIVWDTNN